jgi:hypothetical protein
MSARIRPARRALLASGAALALTAGLLTTVAVGAADAAPAKAVASRSADDGAHHQRHTGTDDRKADDHGKHAAKQHTKADDRGRHGGRDDRKADDHGRHGHGADDRKGDDRRA